VPGLLPTLAGTGKALLGFEKGHSGGRGVHGETVTGWPLSFFNVMGVPRCPCHELLHTFLSSAILLLLLHSDLGRSLLLGKIFPAIIPVTSGFLKIPKY
jgi:hypothetical protein